MKHVAMLIPTIDRIGGAERQVILLAHGLTRRNWHVTVVTLAGTGGEAATELRRNGIGYFSLQMRKGLADLRGWFFFHIWLRKEQPDVLHAHLPHAAWFARWSHVIARHHAVVDTIHTCTTGTAGRRFGYRISDRFTSLVTAVSASVAERYTREQMVAPSHLRIIPNGIDTDEWRPDAEARSRVRKELGIKNEFVWLAVGRIDPVKDHATLLRAFEQLERTSHLLIAGTGPFEGAMRQFAIDLGIEHRVHFLGFRKDIARVMQAADGFVQTSLWEGLPMAILEASACTRPIVATDVPGIRDAVVHCSTGLLTQVREPRAVANAMQLIMCAPEATRRAMGLAGRRLVVENFSLSSALDQWEELYASLPARHDSRFALSQSRSD